MTLSDVDKERGGHHSDDGLTAGPLARVFSRWPEVDSEPSLLGGKMELQNSAWHSPGPFFVVAERPCAAAPSPSAALCPAVRLALPSSTALSHFPLDRFFSSVDARDGDLSIADNSLSLCP